SIGEFKVNNGKTDSIKAVAASDMTAFIKSGDKCEIELCPEISNLRAPIKTGDIVGSVKVMINGAEYGKVDVVSENECLKRGYLDVVDEFISNW
ncbi:MAG: hypothetical protein J1F39_04225, partial [Clostridiales bacterium]|nr:hypothetical protein [Clostridiales bacterium]